MDDRETSRCECGLWIDWLFFSAGFSIGQESEISPVFLVIRSPRVLYRVPWSNEVMAVMWLNWFYFHKRLTM